MSRRRDDDVDPGCTGKRQFLTWDQAKVAVGHSKFKSRKGRGQVKIYRCRRCHHWHYGASSFSIKDR